MTVILAMIGGAYCAATYYVMRDYAAMALNRSVGFGFQLYAASMFAGAPITAPLLFALMILVY